MSIMPPSPFLSAASDAAAGTAAVLCSPPPGAAASPSTAAEGGPETPAADAPNPHETAGDLDETDCIHEIFYHARKLNRDRRFVLDVDRFMADIEEIPLFLRQA